MQKQQTNGDIINFVIVRPKSESKIANSKDEVVFGCIERWKLENNGGSINNTKCPICNSENCIREFHPVGFDRILCKDCEYEITF